MSSILIARSIQEPLSDAEGFLYGAGIEPSTRQPVAVVRQFASANLAMPVKDKTNRGLTASF